ncbi:MAG: MFS transporter [Alphaproteobacteria bacterium]|nr:MFS transporter [Alphaproteobacteria bacterium]
MPFFAFVRDNVRWLAGGFLLTFFSSFGQTFFIALSAGSIRSEFELSHGEFGTIYMIATLASALTLTQLGKIVDYISVSKVVLIIIPALAIACLGMAFTSNLIMLIVVIYGLRLFGQGMMTHNAITAIGRWYVGQRGRAVSVVTVGHQVGEAALPFLYVSIVAFVGWRETWMMAAAVLILVALPLGFGLMRVERRPQSADMTSRRAAARNWTRAEVLRDPLFWLVSVGLLAPSFIGTTIFFHQVYLIELRGWSVGAFAGSYAFMAVMTVCLALIAGVLVDRFTAVALLPSFLLPLAGACFLLGTVEEQWGVFAFMALVGVSYGLSSTLFGAVWPEIYGTAHLGSIRAVVVALMVFASAMGPGVTGFLIDFNVSYPLQILVMGASCLVICLLMVMVGRMVAERNRQYAASAAA